MKDYDPIERAIFLLVLFFGAAVLTVLLWQALFLPAHAAPPKPASWSTFLGAGAGDTQGCADWTFTWNDNGAGGKFEAMPTPNPNESCVKWTAPNAKMRGAIISVITKSACAGSETRLDIPVTKP